MAARSPRGCSIDDIRSWPDRIRAVTAEQVRDAAQKWLDKKRSVTGYLIKDPDKLRRSARRSAREPISRLARSASASIVVACLALTVAGIGAVARRRQNPAPGVARRHRGLVRAGRHRAPDRDGICLHAAARARTRPASPAPATWSPACSMKVPAISIPRPIHERLDRRAIELSFSSTRDYFRGSLRMLKDNKDEAFDLLQLALTSARFDPDRRRAHPRAGDLRACGATPPTPPRWRAANSSNSPSAIIPMAGRPTARWTACRTSTSPT